MTAYAYYFQFHLCIHAGWLRKTKNNCISLVVGISTLRDDFDTLVTLNVTLQF